MPVLNRLSVDCHRHELHKMESEIPFECDGCKEFGLGPCYKCPRTKCNYILHVECVIRDLKIHPIFKHCTFQFHKEAPSGSGTKICDVCTFDINGFLYQCSHRDHTDTIDMHPYCGRLPGFFTLPVSDTTFNLRKKTKSRCLKCGSKKRSSGKVQCLSYVSSDDELCYHVSCVKDAFLENWKKGNFELDAIRDDLNKRIALQNLAPREVVPQTKVGQSSKFIKGLKWSIMFLKLVFSAFSGDLLTLISTSFHVLRVLSRVGSTILNPKVRPEKSDQTRVEKNPDPIKPRSEKVRGCTSSDPKKSESVKTQVRSDPNPKKSKSGKTRPKPTRDT